MTILSVRVSGRGVVRAVQRGVTKRKPALIKAVRAGTKKAGRVSLRVVPNAAGKRALAKRGKLSMKVRVTYTPRSGNPKSKARTVTIRRR